MMRYFSRNKRLCSFLLLACSTSVKGMDTGEIIKKYDLKVGSEVEIGLITDENLLKIGDEIYDLNDALPYPIYTAKSTYMFNGEEQSLPEVRVFYKKIGDEVVTILKAEDGTTDGISIYSEEGDLRVSYENVGDNEFAAIQSNSIDYETLSENFHYGDMEDKPALNLRHLVSSDESASGKTHVACESFKEIELAVAYESSFCSKNSGTKSASDQKVIQVVAGVSIKYQQTGLCTKVNIVYMEGYCDSATDPYKKYVDLNNSGCGNSGLLQGFQNYWNDNRKDIKRDDAQLFSGTGLECNNGSCVIGCAYVGTLCGSNAYGVNNVMFSGNSNSQQVLVAHELGHNCDGSHYTPQNYIMNPSINAASNGFSLVSRNSFLQHFNQVSCIEDETGTTLSPAVYPTVSPTVSPTVTCVDDADFSKNRGGRDRTCSYIGDGNKQWRINKWCNKKYRGQLISEICCATCAPNCKEQEIHMKEEILERNTTRDINLPAAINNVQQLRARVKCPLLTSEVYVLTSFYLKDANGKELGGMSITCGGKHGIDVTKSTIVFNAIDGVTKLTYAASWNRGYLSDFEAICTDVDGKEVEVPLN